MNEQMNIQQALQRIEQPQSMALDAVGRKAAIDDLLNKVALVQEVMTKVMHDGEHFGKIPGCGDKPALLKAGAEKLGMTFRLKASFEINERDLGNGHREYSIRCFLSDGNMGVGSCSTMESKYRYRQGERKCPECGKATIITGKKEYGGGFLCFAKKGGCGAKFTEDDTRITDQQVGKVEYDNPADFYNTCLKMGKKRAHVDAIITATACSDIFTQDVEEMVPSSDTVVTAPPPQQQAPPAKTAAPQAKATTTAKAPPSQNNDGTQVYPACMVKMVTEAAGNRKSDGKPWRRYDVLINDGFQDMECSTFSKTVGKMAEDLSTKGVNCEVTIRKNERGGNDLVNILERQPEGDDQPSMSFDDAGNPTSEVVP